MIKSLFASACFCLLLSATFAQTDHIGNFQPPAHPRILFLKGEEAGINKTIAADTLFTNLQKAILAESTNLLSQPPLERIQIGRRLLDKSREALRRFFFLGYAYRMTKETRYAQRAEKELLAICNFSDWNPSHFLDVAEMTMAVAIGYDWLYDQLSPQTRGVIKEAILNKGLKPSFDNKYNSWLRAEHNWNQVCNAGMTYGALAIYDEEPQLAKQVINRAIESIQIAMKDYGPDGAYPEGYGYWGYGTSFNVLFISALEKLFKKDFGLSSVPGFLKTAGFLENMTGPSGMPFNFSDAGSNGGLQPAMFWFASRLKDPSLLWVEKTRKVDVRNRILPAILIWSHGIRNIQAPVNNMWVGKGKNPVALMRTSWTDPKALFVGMKGGSVSVNHAHMDIGSFVMDADGVRWAMDFGMQDYESLESKGIQLFGRTQNAQRWTVFRYTNLVHNTLAINGRHQLVTGTAPITSFGNMYAITDLSEVYAPDKVKRGIAIVDKQYVVVRDEVVAAETDTIRWTLLTPANVRITGSNTAELTQQGKTLLLKVQCDLPVMMKTWSTDPPHDYDAPNPGTVMVGFEVVVPKGSAAWQVSLVPGAKEVDAKMVSLDLWK